MRINTVQVIYRWSCYGEFFISQLLLYTVAAVRIRIRIEKYIEVSTYVIKSP
jgi:hypothetical protein